MGPTKRRSNLLKYTGGEWMPRAEEGAGPAFDIQNRSLTLLFRIAHAATRRTDPTTVN